MSIFICFRQNWRPTNIGSEGLTFSRHLFQSKCEVWRLKYSLVTLEMASGTINYTTELSAKHQTQSAAEAQDQAELHSEGGNNILQVHYGWSTGGVLLNLHSPVPGRPSSPAHGEETETQRSPLTSNHTTGRQQSWASNVTLSDPQNLILRQKAYGDKWKYLYGLDFRN